MIRRIILDKKPIYVIADLHGYFNALKAEINLKDYLKDCIIICAGDIGVGFNTKDFYLGKFEELNNIMQDKNIDCLMIRGNHDDPSYFNGSIFLSNVKLIPDYTVITSGEANILCVGGAISIDRLYRKKIYQSNVDYISSLMPTEDIENIKNKVSKNYWENEAPILDCDTLKEINDNGIKINYVVTHTSPSFAFKNDKKGIENWLKNDETLDLDTSYERNVMDSIYNILKENGNELIYWVYGHFHEHWEGEKEKTKFIALCNFDYISDIFKMV